MINDICCHSICHLLPIDKSVMERNGTKRNCADNYAHRDSSCSHTRQTMYLKIVSLLESGQSLALLPRPLIYINICNIFAQIERLETLDCRQLPAAVEAITKIYCISKLIRVRTFLELNN